MFAFENLYFLIVLCGIFLGLNSFAASAEGAEKAAREDKFY